MLLDKSNIKENVIGNKHAVNLLQAFKMNYC